MLKHVVRVAVVNAIATFHVDLIAGPVVYLEDTDVAYIGCISMSWNAMTSETDIPDCASIPVLLR